MTLTMKPSEEPEALDPQGNNQAFTGCDVTGERKLCRRGLWVYSRRGNP